MKPPPRAERGNKRGKGGRKKKNHQGGKKIGQKKGKILSPLHVKGWHNSTEPANGLN
jgi:hypothetical protein